MKKINFLLICIFMMSFIWVTTASALQRGESLGISRPAQIATVSSFAVMAASLFISASLDVHNKFTKANEQNGANGNLHPEAPGTRTPFVPGQPTSIPPAPAPPAPPPLSMARNTAPNTGAHTQHTAESLNKNGCVDHLNRIINSGGRPLTYQEILKKIKDE